VAAIGTHKAECPACHETISIPLTVGTPHLREAGDTRVVVTITGDAEVVRRHFANHPRGGGEPLAMAV